MTSNAKTSLTIPLYSGEIFDPAVYEDLNFPRVVTVLSIQEGSDSTLGLSLFVVFVNVGIKRHIAPYANAMQYENGQHWKCSLLYVRSTATSHPDYTLPGSPRDGGIDDSASDDTERRFSTARSI